MTFQLHAQAVLDLLDGDNVPPALVVKDGFVETGAVPPYVVVHFSTMSPESVQALDSSNLDSASNRVDCFAYCHSVGGNQVAARAVAARVRSALLDVAPAVAGRATWPIRHIENQPPVRDESTGKLVIDQVDVYRLSSVPA